MGLIGTLLTGHKHVQGTRQVTDDLKDYVHSRTPNDRPGEGQQRGVSDPPMTDEHLESHIDHDQPDQADPNDKGYKGYINLAEVFQEQADMA